MTQRSRWQRWRRTVAITFGVGTLGLLALWIAIGIFPSLGPALADGARALFGPTFVAKLEDLAYGVQDDVNRVRHKDAPPVTFWEATEDAPEVAPVPTTKDAGARSFPPPPATPPHPKAATEHDGVWLWMSDDAEPKGEPVLAKTQLHPDPKRTQAVVAIVAVDLSQTELVMMPGTEEPISKALAERPGKIPEADHPALLAAFNGGWQTIHGHYGMKAQGVELLPPRDHCCTLGVDDDGELRIGTWSKLEGQRERFVAYRQTPQCLWESSVMNPELSDGTRNWGAAVGGDTIIRRSGVGLNPERTILFYGIGDNLSAKTLAEALVAAGASDVAELDVNWTFPRFLTYRHDQGPIPQLAESLVPSPNRPGIYVTKAWHRDFFYLKRKQSPGSSTE